VIISKTLNSLIWYLIPYQVCLVKIKADRLIVP